MRLTLAFFVALSLAAPGLAQPALPFTVEIEELDRPGLPGLHSFTMAEHGGRWLFVGGRTNGLHGFAQNPFPNEFANGDLVVLDPATGDVWTAALDGLDAATADPLRATNAQGVQRGDTLFLVGGYGNSTATGGKVTFSTLTALDVPGLMAAVVNGAPVAPFIQPLGSDPALAVTGGGLVVLGDRFYLVGGQRFDGEYGGSSFSQAYTDAVRSFRLAYHSGVAAPTDFSATTDAVNFHRRDGNLVPFVFSDGREGFAQYGGVFTPNGLAIRQPVYADGAALTVDAAFQPQFGHYTCPTLGVFDAQSGAMHTTFFGGMGQFYVDEGTGAPVQDFLLPFIDDVTAISRAADGTSSERILPFRMPALLGTNAAFLLEPGIPHTTGGVVRLRDLKVRTLVGYIYGGIRAGQPNFDQNTTASGRLFAVYLDPTRPTSSETEAPVAFRLPAPYPNPFREQTTVSLTLDRPQAVRAEVFDAIGRQVALLHDGLLSTGAHAFAFRPDGLAAGVYHVRVQGEAFTATRSVVLSR